VLGVGDSVKSKRTVNTTHGGTGGRGGFFCTAGFSCLGVSGLDRTVLGLGLLHSTTSSDIGHSQSYINIRHGSQPVVHQHRTWVIASRKKNSQGKQQAVGLQSKQQLPSSVCGVGLSAVFYLSALRRLRVGSASLNHWTVHS